MIDTDEKIGRMKRPWGVHTIFDMFTPGAATKLPDERWVHSVCVPYSGNRLIAAWWVLTGRAHAIIWPEDGDLEEALEQDTSAPG